MGKTVQFTGQGNLPPKTTTQPLTFADFDNPNQRTGAAGEGYQPPDYSQPAFGGGGGTAPADDPWAGFPGGTSGFGTGTSPIQANEIFLTDQINPFLDRPSRTDAFLGANDVTTPTAGVDIAMNAAAGAMNAPQYQGDLYGNVLASGGPTNWSEDVLKWFGQTSPADISSYYDRAKERSGADINRQFAARGMYGSSAATDALGQAFTDLDAQQAKDEADYGLKRYGLAGTLASGADSADLAGILGLGELASGAGGESLDKFKTAGELGLGIEEADITRDASAANIFKGADRTELDKLGLGAEVAGDVADTVLKSEDQTFDQFLAMARDAAGLAGNAFSNMNAEEMAIMEAIQNGDLAGAKAALENSRNLSERFRADVGLAIEAIGSLDPRRGGKGGGGGGGTTINIGTGSTG